MKKITKKTLYKAINDYCKKNGINYGVLDPRAQERVDREIRKVLKITKSEMEDLTMGW
jgi:hypothetical protein